VQVRKAGVCERDCDTTHPIVMDSLLQCSACSEDAGASTDVFVTACLTDDLMS
jgi:hypothetical protein